MNAEKLSKLQSQVRIGGKGTARRKKKVVHRTATTDDKKLQSSLKKLAVNSIPGIEEVNMFKEDGTVIHFTNPKVQASLPANTFAITGQSETKRISDMMPGILNQLRPENLTRLNNLINDLTNKNAAAAAAAAAAAGGGGGGNPTDDTGMLLAAASAFKQRQSGDQQQTNGPDGSKLMSSQATIMEEDGGDDDDDDDDVPQLVQNFDEAAKITEAAN